MFVEVECLNGSSGFRGGGGDGICAHKWWNLVIIFILVFVMFYKCQIIERSNDARRLCNHIVWFLCFEKWLSYTHVNESTIFMPVILHTRADAWWFSCRPSIREQWTSSEPNDSPYDSYAWKDAFYSKLLAISFHVLLAFWAWSFTCAFTRRILHISFAS